MPGVPNRTKETGTISVLLFVTFITVYRGGDVSGNVSGDVVSLAAIFSARETRVPEAFHARFPVCRPVADKAPRRTREKTSGTQGSL